MSLIIAYHAGFFSCCSKKLESIVGYINKHMKLPDKVDSCGLFPLYKSKDNDDITYDFFEIPTNCEYTHKNKINFHNTDQFKNYKLLDYQNVTPLMKLYFEPSCRIQTTANKFIQSYNICYDNCIALYYRGTDKAKETSIDSFESFHNKLNELLTIANNENMQIMVQTDTSQFLDYITAKHTNNVIIIKELAPSYTNRGTHYERTTAQNYEDITNLFAVVSIISKCKYIICTSGNVSCWIALYRGNAENIYQNFNRSWIK